MIVKSFKEPTDIILIGQSEIRINEKGDKEWHGDFLITDDYCAITFLFGDKKFNIETDGFFNIYTVEEFNKQKQFHDEDSMSINDNFLFLPGFSGDIEMYVEWTRKEYNNETRKREVVETITVSEFPDENEHVLYVDQPDMEEHDYDGNVIVKVPETKVVVIEPTDIDESGDLPSWPKIDNYTPDAWDNTLFNGSRRFRHTQIGYALLKFEDREDLFKDVTHETTRNLGKYLGCKSVEYVARQQDKEFDKRAESSENGPFTR